MNSRLGFRTSLLRSSRMICDEINTLFIALPAELFTVASHVRYT